MTEDWLHKRAFCPCCGSSQMQKYPNNRPAADFYCQECGEDFELKSQAKRTASKIADGAYHAMIQRITSNQNPNFLLLAYDRSLFYVTELVLIPKHFFSPAIIEQRKPLAETARRKGWIGCNIRLDGIPQSGRIAIVQGGEACLKSNVVSAWRHTLFLREQGNQDAKGWLLAVMRVIENLGRHIFTLADIYASLADLRLEYPNNHNVEAKVRQQLQVLRDKGYLKFLGRGSYALSGPARNSGPAA